ncbi:hypothetical protein TRVL_03329 [Trypanosoma vivax]|uniref:Uncharacterized protein n=1 Tax=Trypanosoma vivax (strain Y486) TaxID=1055687 RepID=G0TZ58_TRYVY|nr:hypothetical protein TRVL_03329 [Trypanosoma vivax]CCC49261.1 conserved hypothetical protein [Trypanosoma vivax Y486]
MVARANGVGSSWWRHASFYMRLVLGLLVFILNARGSMCACGSPEDILTKVHGWGFRGSGYHMQLEVEFPLVLDTVHISFNLPHVFFFDASEVVQSYNITAKESGVDASGWYAPLNFSSQQYFDIEQPAFRVEYQFNTVQLTLRRPPPPSRDKSHNSTAVSAGDGDQDAAMRKKSGSAVLVVPIHSRYELADGDTNFSVASFFDRHRQVVSCISEVIVRGTVVNTAGRCVEFITVDMRPFNFSHSPNPEPGNESNLGLNCRNIPVALLSSHSVVHTGLMVLQFVGATIVVLSLWM